MAIEDLVRVVTPPDVPLQVDTGRSWRAIQDEIGIDLPDDLRQLATTYGSGRFCKMFMVFNPFASTYSQYIKFECDLLNQLMDNEGDQYIPYNVFPYSPGLLPWGSDDNGHTMLWLTDGPAEEWPIVLRSRDNEYERHDLNMTTFLEKVINQELSCLLWSQTFFDDPQKRIFEAEEVS